MTSIGKGRGGRAGDVTKRAFDVVVTAVGLVLLFPFMLTVALVIVATSPGGALFVHRRVGRHERTFWCYKFRTMAASAPLAGSHEVAGTWTTPVGKFLRKWKIDELPQLLNVLRGDMSLVGPRPCLPGQQEVIAARREKHVFAVRPGITGTAQLAAIDMSTPEELAEADADYVAHRSFLGDLVIIAATVLGKGTGDAVRYDRP